MLVSKPKDMPEEPTLKSEKENSQFNIPMVLFVSKCVSYDYWLTKNSLPFSVDRE